MNNTVTGTKVEYWVRMSKSEPVPSSGVRKVVDIDELIVNVYYDDDFGDGLGDLMLKTGTVPTVYLFRSGVVINGYIVTALCRLRDRGEPPPAGVFVMYGRWHVEVITLAPITLIFPNADLTSGTQQDPWTTSGVVNPIWVKQDSITASG